jgi:hypothetical protein
MSEDLINRITYYLSSGGLFNPELADHLAVRNLLMECRDALAQPEQEPVAWEGGEGWESLAWELCADENGEDSCNELIWEGGPIPEPWGDRWMKYEEEAKRLIALVQKHTTPPQRTWVGLTKEERHEISMANRPYCADINGGT